MVRKMPNLGDRVFFNAFLIRQSSPGIDHRGRRTRLKSWERHEMPSPRAGIYVGRRSKSNGAITNYGPEDGVQYNPIAYFEAWLVAYADTKDILVCLPSDVTLEDGNDKVDTEA